MGRQAKINKIEIPDGWSFEAADFANKLLSRKEINRLGYYNENNIKEHPWLKDVDMDLIKNKKIKAPFIPKRKSLKKENKEDDDKEDKEERKEHKRKSLKKHTSKDNNEDNEDNKEEKKEHKKRKSIKKPNKEENDD